MKLSAPIYILKQQAKTLARKEKIPLHAALDLIATREGFGAWSLLAAQWNAADSSSALYARLDEGDLVLLAARPAQGKTLLSLELAIQCMARGGRAAFFTLDLTEADIARCFAALDKDRRVFEGQFLVDYSDAIDADYIVGRLASEPSNMLIVVDYLQLLDQKRDSPTLMEQVVALKGFAKERRQTIVCISQIARRFDETQGQCPGLDDVRLPNPLDLALFDKACFLSGGKMQLHAA